MEAVNYEVKRILIRRDEKSGTWVGQCVDFDLCAQAKTREALFKAVGHVYYGEFLVALENRRMPVFCDAPMSAKIEWANRTERSMKDAEKIPWSAFVPDWAPAAFGKLSAMFLELQKKPVEIDEPATAAA